MNYENTSLWQMTLGRQGDKSIDRLRTSYESLRNNMKGLLDEVRADFPNLTDHSIEHVDYLWRIASIITGENYPINPLEGFILGCSFLVHDSVLSYKAFGGRDSLRETVEWKDSYQDIVGTQYDTEESKKKIDFKVIRHLHAKKCRDILLRQFTAIDGSSYYLLDNNEMRTHYGTLIGDIAASHHWDIEHLNELQKQVNGLPTFTEDWTIHSVKLACILRCSDAAAIDYGRAPDYLFRILQLNGISKDHWLAQNRLTIALDDEDSSRLMISSTRDFEEHDFGAWNVAYDAVKVIESELEKCQEFLSENEQFQVKKVAGATSRKSLAKCIRTRGWMPSDVNVHISDVAKLITTLGGKELYGKDDHILIVLRELIQNARDAIHARRLLEDKESFAGKITVKVSYTGQGTQLTVEDNGVGMSLDTVSNSLLNFGNSFWHEDAVNIEFPGLKSKGFQSVGQYGIGFFSVFMISQSVVVETRKYCDGLDKAHLVKFPSGLTLAPIFAEHMSTSMSYSTRIRLLLNDEHKVWPSQYVARRNVMGAKNFEVPFFAFLSTLVAGLDVDVYYQEFDGEIIQVHQRIDADNLDKKAWLRALALADYQQDVLLDSYIEANYNRLQYIYDERNSIAGLAAVSTRFIPTQDFLGGYTIGGLMTELHSRNGEYWIGILEKTPGGAKRSGGEFKVHDSVLKNWVYNQLPEIDRKEINKIETRYRLQMVMYYFKTDPSKIAVVFCIDGKSPNQYSTYSLDALVGVLAQGKKLIFVDSYFMSSTENEGYGDVHLDFSQIAAKLRDDEVLLFVSANSGFFSYKIYDGVPQNNNSFVDCLYRTANLMGYKLGFSFVNDFAVNKLGLKDRALVIEVLK